MGILSSVGNFVSGAASDLESSDKSTGDVVGDTVAGAADFLTDGATVPYTAEIQGGVSSLVNNFESPSNSTTTPPGAMPPGAMPPGATPPGEAQQALNSSMLMNQQQQQPGATPPPPAPVAGSIQASQLAPPPTGASGKHDT